jgi:hypothetical protein
MGTTIKFNSKEISEAIQKKLKIKDTLIRVGYFDDVEHPLNESTRSFLGASNFDRVSMGDLANILNDGFINRVAKSYVPPRPFMDDAREEVKNNIGAILKEASKTNDPIDYISKTIKEIIQDKMILGGYEPNTELTKKFKSNYSVALFDEGHLYNGIQTRIENV